MKRVKYKVLGIAAVGLIYIACVKKSDPTPSTETDPNKPKEYQLVWEDNFNDAALNTANWNIEVNGDGGGNNELQFYRAENVSLGKEPLSGKNCLILTAKKEQFQNKAATSGRVNTKGKKAFKYGKIEASIKIPKTANGLWPAFWTMGNDYDKVGWPKCGEIDILEMGNANGIKNKTQDRYFNGACHWGLSWNGGAYPNYAKDITLGYSIQDDSFHLFTLVWDEKSVKTYVDLDKDPNAKPYFEMNIDDASSDSSPGKYFHKDFFILFNLAVGGHFTGILNINDITALNNGDAKMYIDYVKVYQKK